MKIVSMVLVIFLVAYSALAKDVSVSGLSEEQAAELALQAAKMKNTTPAVTPSKVDEWVNVGRNIGIAITEVAGQLGVAADNFLESTTGKIVLVLVIWKMAGSSIIDLVYGVALFTILFSTWIYFFRRMCLIKKMTVEYPKDTWARKKAQYEYYEPNNDYVNGHKVVFVIMLILIVGVCSIIAL